MFCKKCGFENESNAFKCENCGGNLYDGKLKCKKCGYLNNVGINNCLNCGCSLSESDISCNKTDSKKSNKLNYIIFSIFSFIFAFGIPIILIAISYFVDKKIGNISSVLALLVVASFLFSIFLSTLFTKLLLKNVNNLKKCCLINLYLSLLFIYICLLNVNKSSLVFIVLTFIGFKVFDWFLTRKILIQEKFVFSKKVTIIFSSTVVVLFLFATFIMPTNLNEKLFLKFGNTEFSSKELYVSLIDEYNNSNKENFNYFHKLTSKELSKIDDLSVDTTFSNDDISKLNNLKELSIFDETDVDDNLDFSNLNKLTSLDIFLEDLSSVKLPTNSMLKSIIIYSFLNELDISRMNLEEYNVSAKTLYVKDNIFDISDKSSYSYNNVCFNKLVFGDKSIYLENDDVMCIDVRNKSVNLYNYMNSSNIKGNNLKIVFKSKSFIDEDTSYLDDKFYGNILIYDINDNLLFEGNLNVRV